MIIEFKTITRQEYEDFKKEIKKLFPYVNIRRNKQNYSLGGFNIIPRDYENGFKPFQIEEISKYLKSKNLDLQSLEILKDEVYKNLDEENAEFNGKKINYVIFKDGFYFLKCISNYEEIKNEVLK